MFEYRKFGKAFSLKNWNFLTAKRIFNEWWDQIGYQGYAVVL